MVQLYRITEELQSISTLAEDNPEFDFTKAVDQLEGEFKEKAGAVAASIRNLEAEQKAYEDEIKRLSARHIAKTNAIKSMKAYLKENMELAGIDHLKNGVFDLRLQNNSTKTVLVAPDADLPDSVYTAKLSCPLPVVAESMQEYITERVLRKKDFLEDAKAGGELPEGVTIVQEKHLRIR